MHKAEPYATMTDLAVLNCRQIVTLAGPSGARSGRAREGDKLAAVDDSEVSHRGIRLRLVHPSEARTSAEEEVRASLGLAG